MVGSASTAGRPWAAEYARSLIEASLDPLVTISPEGKITDVNEATVKVTGAPREALVGTAFSDYFTDPDQANAGYQQVFAQGSVTDYPLTIRHRDGRLTDVLYNASVYNDSAGHVLGVFAAARDITERKQAAEYARSLIEASLDPLVTISPEGKITDVNEATVKVTGAPREALVGTDFSDYFTDPDQANAGYQQVFAQGSVTDYPLTIRHRDGRLTDVLYNASVYNDSAGHVLGVFAAARDITERKQAAEYARSLIEASLDPLVTISPEGKITDVNEATVKVTGAPREALVGTAFSDYFTDPDQANAGYQQVFAQGSVTDYPLTIRHRDGRLTDVLYNASVYNDSAGHVLGVFAAARDITAQQVAEAEIARQRERELEQLVERAHSRELLDAVFQTLPDLICIAGMDGHFRVLNPAWEHTFGWATAELCAQPFIEFVHPDDRQRTLDASDAQVLRGEAVTSFENRYRCRDGSYRWLQWNSLPLAVRGILVANARDITERKEAEEALARSLRELERRSEELARSNAELEVFAYVASHDLAEPIRAISGPVSLLARRYGGQLDERADEYIGFAVDGCRRMQALIEDLLQYSRVGRVEGRHERVDCNRVVATVLTGLSRTVAETEAQITVDDLPVVSGEPSQLGQLFQNLISNALKFRAPGVTPRVYVRAERIGSEWRFSVTDNGIGIESRHQDRVFGMFKRLHPRDAYPGTGIGLAICKKIVENHGGRIGIDSAPGGGSRFWFVLPGGDNGP